MVKTLNFILIAFFILSSQCLKSTSKTSEKKDKELNYSDFAQKHLEMMAFSNKLQQTHMKNFNNIQEQILSFALTQQSLSTKDIKKNLLKYFKHIEGNVDILNKEFTKQYSYCTNELKTIFYSCNSRTEKMEKDIKFNKHYIKTLQESVAEYDNLIAKYYESNMLFFAQGVCKISEKNNIVNQYEQIEANLAKYFNLKSYSSNNKEVNLIQAKVLEDSKTPVFIERLLSFFKLSEEHENQIVEQSQYLKNREKLAEKLFNKILLYKNNAIDRKKKLNQKNQALLQKLKENDNNVVLSLADLKRKNKENSELIITLSNDNEMLRKKLRRCEVLNNLNLKCEEMAKIYKSIVSGYEEQAASLEKIYKLIK